MNAFDTYTIIDEPTFTEDSEVEKPMQPRFSNQAKPRKYDKKLPPL